MLSFTLMPRPSLAPDGCSRALRILVGFGARCIRRTWATCAAGCSRECPACEQEGRRKGTDSENTTCVQLGTLVASSS